MIKIKGRGNRGGYECFVDNNWQINILTNIAGNPFDPLLWILTIWNVVFCEMLCANIQGHDSYYRCETKLKATYISYTSKISKSFAILNKTKYILSKNVLHILYQTFVSKNIIYCMEVFEYIFPFYKRER